MMKNRVLAELLLIFGLLSILPLAEAGETRVYLNDSVIIPSSAPAAGYENTTYFLSKNLSLQSRLNHTFNVTSANNIDVEYRASNNSGQYLLRFRIDFVNGADGRILQPTCTSDTAASHTQICSNNCNTGTAFNTIHTYRVEFNATAQNAKLFIDTATPVTLTICTDVSEIGSVRFAANDLDSAPAGGGGTGGGGPYSIRHNFFVANNLPPTFHGTLPNLTWNEDSSITFNISGNKSEPNNHSLSYLHNLTSNFTLFANNVTGFVNFTPNPNYFGNHIVQFFAFDGDNTTGSNLINLTVLNVNDLPTTSSVLLLDTDALNRSNGTLQTLWSYADIENDLQSGNATQWYLNGSEDASKRNLTLLTTSMTNKTQNWTFSISSFDGSNFSLFVNSTSLLIMNSPPIHGTPLLTSADSLSRRNGTLTCANQSTSDADNDVLANLVQWYRNGTLINTVQNSLTLNAGNYSKHDNLTCEITAFDGEANSTRLNSSIFTIQNAAPLLNTSIANSSWDQDDDTTLSIASHFHDVDGDTLSYNSTQATNIMISIDNVTGMATLTSDSGFSGTRTVTFFALDGETSTSSNTVTLTVNAVVTSTSGGGGGGAGGYTCRLDWECSEWSACEEEGQSRDCALIAVPVFKRSDSCPQNTKPVDERSCAVDEKITEICDDQIKNQDEEDVDCGGVCEACAVSEQIASDEQPQENEQAQVPGITGAVIGGKNTKYLIIAAIALAAVVIGALSFARLSRPKNLSQDEVNKILKDSGHQAPWDQQKKL